MDIKEIQKLAEPFGLDVEHNGGVYKLSCDNEVLEMTTDYLSLLKLIRFFGAGYVKAHSDMNGVHRDAYR